MSSIVIGIIFIAVMFLAIFLFRMPISFAMFFAGFLGLFFVSSLQASLGSMALTIYRVFTDYNFTVVPLFVLMGELASVSGISQDAFQTAEKWLRRIPGGLALATIGANAAFASICGSTVASSATIGSVAIPEMKKKGYSDTLATGTVAAGGTLAFLIPPSIGFVIYGVLTEQSVGKLLIAGFFPGLILAVLWLVTILAWVKRNPKAAPMSPERISWKERLGSLRSTWAVLLIFLLVMGGIWRGFFTPTEAGAVGAFGLFIIALGKRKVSFSNLFESLRLTAMVTIMLLLIFSGALVFSAFLALTNLPTAMLSFLGSLNVSHYVVFAMLIAIYLFLGCIMDAGAMLVLTMPVIYPIILSFNFDPIWFGVVAILMMNAGQITPPVGINVYITTSVAKGVPMMTIFKGAAPFLVGIVVVAALITALPQIALFLPNLMIR